MGYFIKTRAEQGQETHFCGRANGNNGLIAATGSISSDPSGKTHALLAIPVDIRDDQDPNNPKHLQSLPPKKQGQSDTDYYQQTVPDSSIAFITGSTTNPLMPQLVASLPNNLYGLSVKWRLEVKYDRGNGYCWTFDQPYSAFNPPYSGIPWNFTQPHDTVTIPISGANATPQWTDEMDSSEQWWISSSDDWNQEVTQYGFFGGTAKLYVWFTDSNPNPPTDPIITFRIGGQNPADEWATKSYIDVHANTVAHPFWYAYMIARKESFEYGGGRYYNQFYTKYVAPPRKRKNGTMTDPIGLGADMDWVAWANAWPAYNYDRWHGNPNGPGGYGIFQLTLGPKTPNGGGSEPFISRGQIWNWQDNVNGAIDELTGKVARATQLYDRLAAAFPSFKSFQGDGCFAAKEAFVVALYNGEAALKIQRAANGSAYLTPWLFKDGKWQLESDYVNEVEKYD